MLFQLVEKENVIITDYKPNRIELAVSLNKPKMLFMSETYYPGWKVYIDGNEGTIYRANYAFRAVPLNPGNHRVVFVYKPLSVILGGVITLVGIVAIVLIGTLFSNSNDRLPRPGQNRIY